MPRLSEHVIDHLCVKIAIELTNGLHLIRDLHSTFVFGIDNIDNDCCCTAVEP